MYQVALVTFADLPDLDKSDQLLLEPLRQRGIEATAHLWDDMTVDWSSFAAVVIRSTWDYHERLTEFRTWIERLAQLNLMLFNPPEILQWNIDKHYLRQVANAGVTVIPTVYVNINTTPNLQSILSEQEWSQAVIKPAVSISGNNTWLTGDDQTADQARFEQLLQQTDVLVQQFMPQIQAGEWSLLFFNGIYSHSVLKTPAAGEFRIHEEYGGINAAIEPPGSIIAQAAYAVRVAWELTGQVPLYARVDGLVVHETFYLMELELLEPSFYLQDVPTGAQRFADALLGRLER